MAESENNPKQEDGESENVLDLRRIPPPQRHSLVFEEFEKLESGEELILVNDHNPKPLYHQMENELESFDAEGYSVGRRGPQEFVAKFPKE